VAFGDKVSIHRDIRFNETLRERALYPEIHGGRIEESHDPEFHNEDHDSVRGFTGPGLVNPNYQRDQDDSSDSDLSSLRDDFSETNDHQTEEREDFFAPKILEGPRIRKPSAKAQRNQTNTNMAWDLSFL